MSEEKEERILKYLREHGRSFIKEIAEGTGMSPSTASKYLISLLSKGKVRKERVLPYIYYERVQGG